MNQTKTNQEQLELAKEAITKKAAQLAKVVKNLKTLDANLVKQKARLDIIEGENAHMDGVLRGMLNQVSNPELANFNSPSTK